MIASQLRAERLRHRPRPSIANRVERLRSRPRPRLPRLTIDDSTRPTGKEAGWYECIKARCSEKAIYRIFDPTSDVIEFYCDGHIDRSDLARAEFLGIKVAV